MSKRIDVEDAEAYELPSLRATTFPLPNELDDDFDVHEAARLLEDEHDDERAGRLSGEYKPRGSAGRHVRGSEDDKGEVVGKGSSVEELIKRVRLSH